jgi:hypothetical protein
MRIRAGSSRLLRIAGTCAVLGAGAGTAAVIGGAGSAAGADPPVAAWNCYASPINLSIGGTPRIDPIHAGGSPCTAQQQGIGDIAGALMVPPDLLTADTLSATTTLDPSNVLSYQQTATADGTIENLHLQLPPGGGGLDLTIQVAVSDATGTCANGEPRLTGTSRLVGITINGSDIPVDSTLQQVSLALAPLAQVIAFDVDKNASTDPTAIDQQALHLTILSAGGPLVDLVAGEAKVAYSGAVCTPPPPPPTVTDTQTVTQATTQTETQTQTETVQSPPPPAETQTVTTPAPAPQQQVEAVTLKPRPNGRNGGCGHITMYFDRNRKRTFTDRFGTRVVTRGRLVNCKGKPIVGARIRVVHIVEGRRHLVKTGLRSRPGGKLTLILPLNLSTRAIEYSYLGNLDSSHVTSRVTLRLTVRDRSGRLVLLRDLRRLQRHR